jgi:hypothetical protein
MIKLTEKIEVEKGHVGGAFIGFDSWTFYKKEKLFMDAFEIARHLDEYMTSAIKINDTTIVHARVLFPVGKRYRVKKDSLTTFKVVDFFGLLEELGYDRNL